MQLKDLRAEANTSSLQEPVVSWNFEVMLAKIQKETHFPITIRHWLISIVAISDGAVHVKMGILLMKVY
jgi:hypothetical protein